MKKIVEAGVNNISIRKIARVKIKLKKTKQCFN
jgi:hypothetical protein